MIKRVIGIMKGFFTGNGSSPGFQALMQAIERELKVTVRVHEVRCEPERQKEERIKMAKEEAELKAEANIAKQSTLSHCTQTMSPDARNSRIFALENMLHASSKTIVSMASQLSEAEESERAFSGRGRWKQVRSLAEAKNVMNYLFNLAFSSRCQLWDKEVDCREKDSEIRGMKEKIVNLIRHVEMQKAELSHMEKIKKLYVSTNRDSYVMDNAEGHMYDLRPKGLRNSIDYNTSDELDELSESEHSEDFQDEWGHRRRHETDAEELHSKDFQVQWGSRRIQNAKKRNSKIVIESNPDTGTQKTSPIEGGDSGIWCSCSRKSSCKTMNCECRAVEGFCSASCNCSPKKCSNHGPDASENG